MRRLNKLSVAFPTGFEPVLSPRKRADRAFAGFAGTVQNEQDANGEAGIVLILTLQPGARFSAIWTRLSHPSITGFRASLLARIPARCLIPIPA
jgi:hypothetical protein